MGTWEKNTVAELQNEEIYRALFDNRREAICIANPDGEILRVNKAACRLFGYTEQEFKEVGTAGVLDKDDPRSAAAVTERSINGHFSGELSCVKKNGDVFPAEVSSTFFQVSDGPEHFFTIINDISESKKKESEMELLLNNTQECFLVVDKDLNIVTFNLQLKILYRELLGSEVKKGDSVKLFALQGNQPIDGILQDVLNGGRHEREMQLEKPDGNIVYFSIQYKPAYTNLGEIIGVFISAVDITQHRNANKKILLDKERYDLVAKAANDAIYDWDIVTNSLSWGEGFTSLFGYDAYEEEHSIESWITHIHPEDLFNIVSGMRNIVYSTTDFQWQGEYRYLRADGTYASILDRGFVIRNEFGKPLRMIGAMQDITERKENESALKKLNKQLEKRAQELAASNEELEQFAYIASHDLQEPLRMITSFLTQLEKKYKDQLDERGQKYIWFAVDGAVRMRQIIFDLLNYSRIGRPDQKKEKLDTGALLATVIQLHSVIIAEKNIKIVVGPLPEITASRVPIEHVFDNLISNAIKYRRDGVAPEITISAQEEKEHCQFSVTDNGIGIGSGFFQKIFILFQRLHNKDEYTGTGMGLAICKKIIENHRGRIWVESELGKGSSFHFIIPK
ncbi:MAG: PAS domain S-box protein [Chitinophagaceae bacterium]|nr:PAS domain S-box protein [Chitinophagaceae bacterium]